MVYILYHFIGITLYTDAIKIIHLQDVEIEQFRKEKNIDWLTTPDTVVASAITSRLPIMIGGDFNAWATEWGSAKTNERVCMLLEAFATLELEIANKGKTPTYSKGGNTSIAVLTLVNTRLMGEGLDWRVSDRNTGSDHQALVYKLQLTSRTAGMDKLPIKERCAPSIFDREAFLCSLEGALLEETAEEKAQSLSRAITGACGASMSTRSNPRGRPPVYWWNEDIAAIRRECLRARRVHQRAARGPTYEELRVAYETKRRELKTAIKMAKRKCWRDLCEEADSDPWGRPYKAVLNKIKLRGPNANLSILSR